MAASRTSSPGRAASGGAPTMSAASPSVRTRSGAKVSLASLAPSDGMVPKGLAMTSPAPRQASAQAMTQDSARVTPGLTLRRVSASLTPVPDSRRCPFLDAGLVLVFGHEDVALGEGVPLAGVTRRRGVLLLERLVACVIGRIGREVRAA